MSDERTPPPDPGIYYDVPALTYRAWDAINYSSISKGVDSMRAMHLAMTTSSKPTPAQGLGTAVHSAILEPDLFAKAPVFDGNRGTKGFEAFASDNGPDSITTKERETAMGLAAIAMNDEDARHIVRQSRHEVCMVWRDRLYGWAKIRIDMMGKTFFGDVKTMRDVSKHAVASAFFGRYGWNYYLQWGWCREGLEQLGHNANAMRGWLIAIETGAVPDAYAVEIEQDVIVAGQKRAVEIAKDYNAARMVGAFDGKVGAYGDDRIVRMPEWMKDEKDTINMEGIDQ